jgi:hypothetical protein
MRGNSRKTCRVKPSCNTHPACALGSERPVNQDHERGEVQSCAPQSSVRDPFRSSPRFMRVGALFARKRGMGARAFVHAEEDPTTRVWKSAVLEGLNRPPNPSSGVESQERIRCDIMNALAAAITPTAVAMPAFEPPIPILTIPIRSKPPNAAQSRSKAPANKSKRLSSKSMSQPNVFLQPRLATDPPPPWVLFALPALEAPLSTSSTASEVSRRGRRRSKMGFVVLGMALLITLGLCVDRNGRRDTASVMKAHAHAVSAHASKLFLLRGR